MTEQERKLNKALRDYGSALVRKSRAETEANKQREIMEDALITAVQLGYTKEQFFTELYREEEEAL